MNKSKTVKTIALLLIFLISIPIVALSQTAEDYDKLKQDYEHILHDRDNLRAQTQFLLKYKNEILKAQDEVAKVEQERSRWEMERQTLKNINKKLDAEIKLLQAQIRDLDVVQFRMEEEKEEVKKSLVKSEAGYIIVDDLKRKIKDQKAENRRLEKTIKRMETKVTKAENAQMKTEVRADILRGQIKELKDKYAKAVQNNKILVKKIERQPKEYAEIARENIVLLKRTALMHYNLGVFYTKSQQYEQAASEFEKAVELNPEDTHAYFNLGYIYAEHYANRPKAIEYFKKYLQLAKKDDKDVDWVKKYILTWQTWEGKDITK